MVPPVVTLVMHCATPDAAVVPRLSCGLVLGLRNSAARSGEPVQPAPAVALFGSHENVIVRSFAGLIAPFAIERLGPMVTGSVPAILVVEPVCVTLTMKI